MKNFYLSCKREAIPSVCATLGTAFALFLGNWLAAMWAFAALLICANYGALKLVMESKP